MQTIRVKRTTDPQFTAGAIAKAMRRRETPDEIVQVRAVGPAAVYQGINALMLAKSYLAADDPSRQLFFTISEERKSDELDPGRMITSTIFNLAWKAAFHVGV